MDKKNFNEVLKKQEASAKKEASQSDNKEMALDSTERIKVLSPGRLVFNRFIRNKLAIAGSAALIFMFIFSFIGPLLYPYEQTEIFYKYDGVVVDYAQATERTDYATIVVDDTQNVHYSVRNNISMAVNQMETEKTEEMTLTDPDGVEYVVSKIADDFYGLSMDARNLICTIGGYHEFATYNGMLKVFNYSTDEVLDAGFEAAVESAVSAEEEELSYDGAAFRLVAGRKSMYTIEKMEQTIQYEGNAMNADFEAAVFENLEAGSFTYGDDLYQITVGKNGEYQVFTQGERSLVFYATTFVFDAYNNVEDITDEFRIGALEAYASGNTFDVNGTTYRVVEEEEEILIYDTADSSVPFAAFSNIAVRAFSGEDILAFSFKEKVREVIDEMTEQSITKTTFEHELPRLDEKGAVVYDENGVAEQEITTITIENQNGNYVMSCNQTSYLIDIYSDPSLTHWFGTDGNGMDVLARMMYGGRISLIFCFIVVIIEVILGIIMGGIAGYFGGWIDNLIMRLVDVFYCIPSLPIMIILGAMFDALKMEPYVRMAWLMALLGFLGWAGVARLVRGQILSLREQEFMVAAEAIGLKTNRRIFKHLMPNVMPQLIVTATAGLGSIIITESTLSFLGLGVKFPLSTWGTMINSVTSSTESMIRYTYIWIPVGLLICLTVIAFNFVGDGLRDAFDPKMKR